MVFFGDKNINNDMKIVSFTFVFLELHMALWAVQTTNDPKNVKFNT